MTKRDSVLEGKVSRMTEYKWGNAWVNADAQRVGERLEVLQHLNGERLTPRLVVEDARPIDSPLHPCFEWDDVRAAELHREHQARQVLRSIRVVTQEDDHTPREARMFVNVIETRGDDEPQHGYVTMARVMSDGELFQQVLHQAARDLAAFEDRYAQFQALVDVGRAAREQVLALTEQIV